jgi:Response regulator containing a CheY-like receiver domain and an HTH DNA-binding domain
VERSTVLILVVDDYEPWRRKIRSTLKQQTTFQVIGEASDGLEAVRKAAELQPDLILLDIGLPKLNGIEAARQIRKNTPQSKILFISQNRDWDIVEEALRTGAGGYVVKSDSRTQLIPAIQAVLEGREFIGPRFGGQDLAKSSDEQNPYPPRREMAHIPLVTEERVNRHEVAFYPDDLSLIAGFAYFIEASLKARNGVIALLNESHRPAIFQRLQANDIDPYAAIEEGRLALVRIVPPPCTREHPSPERGFGAFGYFRNVAAQCTKVHSPRHGNRTIRH